MGMRSRLSTRRRGIHFGMCLLGQSGARGRIYTGVAGRGVRRGVRRRVRDIDGRGHGKDRRRAWLVTMAHFVAMPQDRDGD